MISFYDSCQRKKIKFLHIKNFTFHFFLNLRRPNHASIQKILIGLNKIMPHQSEYYRHVINETHHTTKTNYTDFIPLQNLVVNQITIPIIHLWHAIHMYKFWNIYKYHSKISFIATNLNCTEN